MISRFLVVGLANTMFGYAVILSGLWLGLGDYLANALGYGAGLALSYVLHRKWTFAVKTKASWREAGRFVLAAGLSYGVNLAVIHQARAAGFVDSPLAQAAAMVSYSVAFFLLSRFMVFAGSAPDARPRKGANWRGLWPEGVLVLAAAITFMVMHSVELSNDVIWQFWVARQMLGGAQLYVQIWEVNPPLWFWSAVPVEWFAQQTGLRWENLLIGAVVILSGVSAWLTAQMVNPADKRARLALMLLVFAVSAVFPWGDLGERDALVLMFCLPYLALIGRRHAGEATGMPLAAAIGIFAACGFALKHYFVLVPLLLELWLILRQRKEWRPWRPELLVLGTLGLIYAAAVLWVTPAYLTAMVPMVTAAYGPFENPLSELLQKLWVFFWVISAGFLIVTRREPQLPSTRALARFEIALWLGFACFVLSYFMQHKGWSYHALPATGAMIVLLLIRLAHLRRFIARAYGLILLVIPAYCAWLVAHEELMQDPNLNAARAGETIFVASPDAGLAWPAIDRGDLVWTSRAYSLWMVPAIGEAYAAHAMTPELRALSKTVLDATARDLLCNPPELILFDRVPEHGDMPGVFTMRGFLMRDARIKALITQHYRELPVSPIAYSFRKKDNVVPDSGPDCRVIR